MMMGGAKKAPKQRDEPIEEEREKIKMDIFDDLDDENKPSPTLNNVSSDERVMEIQEGQLEKPVMAKAQKKTTQYDMSLFDFDDE